MGNADGFHLILTVLSLSLITGSHQDRIVNGCTQLDGTNNNTCNERNADSLILRHGHIDKNGKFNNRNQNDRKGN